MGLFRKIEYSYILFRSLPWGLVCFFGGFYYLSQIPELKELHRFKGEIVKQGEEMRIIAGDLSSTNVFYLTLRNEIDEVQYYTRITTEINTIRQQIVNAKIGTVWYKFNSSVIEQLELDGKLIIKYKKPYGVFIFFILLGIAAIISSVYYLITQKKHLNEK